MTTAILNSEYDQIHYLVVSIIRQAILELDLFKCINILFIKFGKSWYGTYYCTNLLIPLRNTFAEEIINYIFVAQGKTSWWAPSDTQYNTAQAVF